MMAAEGLTSHDWAVIFDASSRIAEVVVTVLAALYARRGVKLVHGLSDFLGLGRARFWQRKRPGRWSEDPALDKLRNDADRALGEYLEAASKVDHYMSKPAEGKHR
jgi:hypothetical protein